MYYHSKNDGPVTLAVMVPLLNSPCLLPASIKGSKGIFCFTESGSVQNDKKEKGAVWKRQIRPCCPLDLFKATIATWASKELKMIKKITQFYLWHGFFNRQRKIN